MTGLLGVILERILAFGASAPWKRMRLSLGRGTRAARRCMNSSGDITMWVVPSLYGAFELQHDIAGAVELEPFVGDGGACDIAAQLFEFVALIHGAAYLGMEAEPLRVGTALFGRLHLSAGDRLQSQHFLPARGPSAMR